MAYAYRPSDLPSPSSPDVFLPDKHFVPLTLYSELPGYARRLYGKSIEVLRACGCEPKGDAYAFLAKLVSVAADNGGVYRPGAQYAVAYVFAVNYRPCAVPCIIRLFREARREKRLGKLKKRGITNLVHRLGLDKYLRKRDRWREIMGIIDSVLNELDAQWLYPVVSRLVMEYRRREVSSGRTPKMLAAGFVYAATLLVGVNIPMKNIEEASGARKNVGKTAREILTAIGIDVTARNRVLSLPKHIIDAVSLAMKMRRM